MSRLHVKYLIVGGGLAGNAAVHGIRELDSSGSLLVIAQETSRPYHRPPLSKEYLRGTARRESLFVDPAGWFTEHDVQLRTAHSGIHLDAERSALMLDTGEEISYDRLLLATGGSPMHLHIPGVDLPSLHYLRTLDDAQRLRHAIDKALIEGRTHARPSAPSAAMATGRGVAAVIGGGVLGVELAASLRQMGLEVDLIINAAQPWPKFAGEGAGKFIARALESHGVRVHGGSVVQRLEGDGRVQRVVVAGRNPIDCDFVVAAVGMIPNKKILRGTSIAAEKAILVDEHCRTSVKNVFAAGDCAAVFDPLFGKHRILDHWDNAQITGALAGHNMAGADESYSAVNFFFSDVFDLSLRCWGSAEQVDRRLVRNGTSLGGNDYLEIGVASDGRIAQALVIGHPALDETLRELVRRRFQAAGHEEAIKDPHSRLEDLLQSP